MDIETSVFQRSTVNFKKLQSYGFLKTDYYWKYERLFMDNNFRAIITVDDKGNLKGKVFEESLGDEYLLLRVEGMQGFAEKVRIEYKHILEDIKKNCYITNYFIYEQSNQIAQRIIEKYGDIPVFPWETDKGYGVFKNPKSHKWYGIIMNIDHQKIDKSKSGEIEIINVKLDKNKIKDLLKQKGFYPAYHMNKQYWITIVLNNLIPTETIMNLINESYHLTEK